MSSSAKKMSPALTSPDPAALMKSRPKPGSRSPTPPPNGALRRSSRHGGIKLSNGEGGAVAYSGLRDRTRCARASKTLVWSFPSFLRLMRSAVNNVARTKQYVRMKHENVPFSRVLDRNVSVHIAASSRSIIQRY